MKGILTLIALMSAMIPAQAAVIEDGTYTLHGNTAKNAGYYMTYKPDVATDTPLAFCKKVANDASQQFTFTYVSSDDTSDFYHIQVNGGAYLRYDGTWALATTTDASDESTLFRVFEDGGNSQYLIQRGNLANSASSAKAFLGANDGSVDGSPIYTDKQGQNWRWTMAIYEYEDPGTQPAEPTRSIEDGVYTLQSYKGQGNGYVTAVADASTYEPLAVKAQTLDDTQKFTFKYVKEDLYTISTQAGEYWAFVIKGDNPDNANDAWSLYLTSTYSDRNCLFHVTFADKDNCIFIQKSTTDAYDGLATADDVSNSNLTSTYYVSGDGAAEMDAILYSDKKNGQNARWIYEQINTTAVINVTAVDDNAPVEYFNLQGLRVENPSNGIFIRRQGQNISKVYVK
jgi:hypothetical protein